MGGVKYTDSAKFRLRLGIEILQKYGRRGATIADELFRRMPVDERFDKDAFMRELERRMKNETNTA